jgi:hypothetical protein
LCSADSQHPIPPVTSKGLIHYVADQQVYSTMGVQAARQETAHCQTPVSKDLSRCVAPVHKPVDGYRTVQSSVIVLCIRISGT